MIQEKSKNFTFVVYENQKPTKCFEFKKSYLRFLFFATPSLLVMGLMVLLFLIVYLRNIENIKIQDPPELKALKQERDELAVKAQKLEESNKNLLSKLNSPPIATTTATTAQKMKQVAVTGVATISAPTTTLYPLLQMQQGMKDLTKTDLLNIGSENFRKSGGQAILGFNIVNKGSEERMTGYTFIVLKGGSFTSLYPSIPNNPPYKFEQGESFSVSRFRPVEASFDIPANINKSLSFEILIFAKNGDLLFKKNLGPYN